MPIYAETNTPQQNLDILAANPYFGRLLVVGYAGSTAVLGYAIEGRSLGSRNRVLVHENNVISTAIRDSDVEVGDPSLTIYDAMMNVEATEVVSNGNQTDTVISYLSSGQTFESAMAVTEHEPDSPNFTPRITGTVLNMLNADRSVQISVNRKNPDADGTIVDIYSDKAEDPEHHLDIEQDNFAYAVHTYKGNEDPLRTFDERPFRLPVSGRPTEMAEMLWSNMNRRTRVAVATKLISDDGFIRFHIINKKQTTGFVYNPDSVGTREYSYPTEG